MRRTTRADLDLLYPACVAMYTEEVGVSPELGGGAELYRARVQQLISRGWSFARLRARPAGLQGRGRLRVAVRRPDPGRVRAAPTAAARGSRVGGMAAVVDLVRREIAPTVSLYVNEWNIPPGAAYERVGFRETARFSTVMF